MKRLFYLVAVLCAGLAVTTSCNKDGEEIIATYHMLRIATDDFVIDDDTKEEFAEFDWRWVSNDVVGVFPIAPKVNNEMQTFYFSQYGVSNNCALFTGKGWDFDKNEDYLAYYPYNSVNYQNESHKAIVLNYNGQMQYGNGNTDGIKAFDYLYSREVVRSEEYLDITMAHAGALVKFVFDGFDEEAMVKELVLGILDEQNNPVGKFVTNETLDLSTMDGRVNVSNESTKFVVGLRNHNPNEGIMVSARQKLIVYAMMASQNLTGMTIHCSLMDEAGKSVKNYKIQGLNFEANHAYNIFAK